MQLGYVGSRSNKLLIMWYLNRGQPAAGLPQTTATINARRENPDFAEIRYVLNGSRGYFDAARATLLAPRFHGLTMEAVYTFSKAIDLGADYTNTAYDADSRLSRSQWEYETQKDRKALSRFDQPHTFLLRASYDIPAKYRRLDRESLQQLDRVGCVAGQERHSIRSNHTRRSGIRQCRWQWRRPAESSGHVDSRPGRREPGHLGQSAAGVGVCVDAAYRSWRESRGEHVPARRHSQSQRGGRQDMAALVGGAADLPRGVNQPDQHTSIRRAGKCLGQPGIRHNHEHIERRPDVSAELDSIMVNRMKRILLAMFLVCLPLMAQKFRAGAAAVDITPQEWPVRIIGNFGLTMANSAHDPLHARAIVLEDSGMKIAIALVDSCYVKREEMDRAKALASKRTGIPTNRILLSATHAHSAPPSRATAGNGLEERYVERLVTQVAEAIAQANGD